jgi:PAS domain S-box-containing protein
MADREPPRKRDAALHAGELRSKAQHNLDELRRHAELRLDEPAAAAAAAAAAASLAPDDIAAVIHELQVHQIELEMQNEELHRTHAELNAQREKYFERFEMAPVGYLVLDEEGIVSDSNLTAAHLLGVERDILVGQPLSAFVYPLEQDAFYLLMSALRKSGQGQSGELRLQRLARGVPDPGQFWALLEARPERAGDGTPAGAWVAFTDIDERKQGETEVRRLNDELEERVVSRTAQLEATNKELEAFAYSVSHDLRAPLRAIDGFSQMVIEDAAGKLSEVDVEHLQRVRAGAQRMAALIDELLGLSRASNRDLLRDEVDLSAMASEVLAGLRESQPDRRVDAVVAPGMKADADPALLRIVLDNLLGNAWKFTSKHETARIGVGFCEVGAPEAGGERAFFVRDDGAGFDAQYATHLFGAFQRMHAAGLFEGDGIGLATVQRLITRHGGRVWAEAAVEKGATFYFTLPPAAVGD